MCSPSRCGPAGWLGPGRGSTAAVDRNREGPSISCACRLERAGRACTTPVAARALGAAVAAAGAGRAPAAESCRLLGRNRGRLAWPVTQAGWPGWHNRPAGLDPGGRRGRGGRCVRQANGSCSSTTTDPTRTRCWPSSARSAGLMIDKLVVLGTRRRNRVGRAVARPTDVTDWPMRQAPRSPTCSGGPSRNAVGGVTDMTWAPQRPTRDFLGHPRGLGLVPLPRPPTRLVRPRRAARTATPPN